MARKSSLNPYLKKRNFARTDEPRGEPEDLHLSKDCGDYMIHLHDARALHYDLRLQWRGVLKCWAVPKGPSNDPSVKRLAIRTEDHPDEYKSYEGVIPKESYGAGPSLIWDAGHFTPIEDFDDGLEKGHVRFFLEGIKLKGAFSLIRIKGYSGKENWLLVKEQDEYAGLPTPNRENFPESVASGRTLEDLLKEAGAA